LEEALTAAREASAGRERAEREAAAARDAADALAAAKALLQRTLVEQLAALRAQLEASSQQNRELEKAVMRQRGAQEDAQQLMPPPPPRPPSRSRAG
jgi:hypothetical protein